MLDLERADLLKIVGMTPEGAEQLLAFLTDLTADEPGEDAAKS